MSVATIGSVSDGPLTREHHHELALAAGRAKKIRKAAGVAAFNGWTTGIFAAVSAPFAPFSVAGFLVTAGLTLIAYNEFQGRKRLLRFDPSSPWLLGWNQVALLTLITVYCLWMLFTGLTVQAHSLRKWKRIPKSPPHSARLTSSIISIRVLIAAVYGTVIVFSAVFQGLNALDYFTRRKHVEAYLHETPHWVLDVQRVTGLDNRLSSIWDTGPGLCKP